MTKLDELSFKPLFGDWWPKIAPFFYEGGFDPIYEHLKFESRRGKRIAPLSENVYKAFQLTPYNELYLIFKIKHRRGEPHTSP